MPFDSAMSFNTKTSYFKNVKVPHVNLIYIKLKGLTYEESPGPSMMSPEQNLTCFFQLYLKMSCASKSMCKPLMNRAESPGCNPSVPLKNCKRKYDHKSGLTIPSIAASILASTRFLTKARHDSGSKQQ